MIESIIKKIFGDPSEKAVQKISAQIQEIRNIEEKLGNLSKEEIQKKTKEFQKKFENLNFLDENDSKKIIDTLDDIKLEAFAIVVIACKALNGKEFTLSDGKKMTWNMIPYDVQLIGGLAIHGGNIGEMKTGEGKTLVATLPAYLNALTGNPVHIVTVNDYLAHRDAEEMGILYNFLGLSVGVVSNGQDTTIKKKSYQSDIVYATNNELGFDYLRDNMVIHVDQKVQSALFFGIIDEVDSILIDEARTPLIISQPDSEPTSKYMKFATIAKKLKKGTHYKVDEKQKTALITEEGIHELEKILKVDNIYVSGNYNDIHHTENAIKAASVYHEDKDYLVRNGEVMIIDEHTGRVLAGRRYSEGLHQAIEAKHGVDIQPESKTLASITFQNYFRMYWKLAGMTGTAFTEREEFYKVYSLDTLVIPTNKPIAREDKPDLLFKNEKGKLEYTVNLIEELTKTGQPILVGTVSVDKSEYLSKKLQAKGIKHEVLNAKQHEREAEIVSRAGQKGAITIATNMAGRGTDIKLGEGVKELGGLIILGTEKHETRRIDNQLRGRSGRQGDPGMTQFLISPHDDIMRIFGGDKLFGVFNSPMFASLPDDEPLSQSGILTRKVTSVQKQVEGHHFDMRKHILEYDDVINKHRSIIYTKRNKVLETDSKENLSQASDLHDEIATIVEHQITSLVHAEMLQVESHTSNKQDLIKKVHELLGKEIIDDVVELDDVLSENNPETLSKYITEIALKELGSLLDFASNKDDVYNLEKRIMLQSIDELWMRHIDAMTRLREEVAFEGYAQRNPLVVYQEKAYDKFSNLLKELEYKIVKAIFSVQKVEQVVNVDTKNREENSQELEQTLENFSTNDKQSTPKVNPLFANPGSPKNIPHNITEKQQKKTKIRV